MSDFDKELDTSGLNCPLPIIKAKKEINKPYEQSNRQRYHQRATRTPITASATSTLAAIASTTIWTSIARSTTTAAVETLTATKRKRYE